MLYSVRLTMRSHVGYSTVQMTVKADNAESASAYAIGQYMLCEMDDKDRFLKVYEVSADLILTC